MSIKTEAIVLHAKPFRDADRLYEVLTPSEGMLTLVARGAAKSSSKMTGFLQPFDRVRLMIGRGRMDHIAGVATQESFRNLRASWPDFILASSLVELVLKLHVPGVAARREFDLFLETLRVLDDGSRSARDRVIIGRIFLWKLFSIAGWRPNIDSCAVCREALAHAPVSYDAVKGFVCRAHAEGAMQLPASLMVFLADVMDNGDWNALIATALGGNHEREWFSISQKYYQDILEAPIESLKLFQYV
ncbi:MAG: DNA repair protein RecO [Candidatus Komeilibacteria bacterium RIFCSPLOWO2_01_FULL_53_11]|uniref:DNA repair protein RecO n=1 Tax=Candidatus Komeilibacteria bacterium RIFCSPLOWO2_01_FULL_53_11 TaxID=1798552 RepID=A0A1G2BVZ7_9BACT|nr:MAG: DNA repair protein RecO [Candidatus Komeilibacteria bacterium RIFCSPLOWO2_01_FULL_53_11]